MLQPFVCRPATVAFDSLHLDPGEHVSARLLKGVANVMVDLVEELLGYSMRKEHSAVDWSRRPLPESWLLYAALDVEMLLELRDVLAAQLETAGKAEWARQEFAAWARMSAPAPRHEPWRRTSGIHRVRGRRGLAIVREMWELRDQLPRTATWRRARSSATRHRGGRPGGPVLARRSEPAARASRPGVVSATSGSSLPRWPGRWSSTEARAPDRVRTPGRSPAGPGVGVQVPGRGRPARRLP